MQIDHVVPEEWRRIAYGDIDALFAHGGCHVFALCVHEKHGYSIRGFRLVQNGAWNHVWARVDELRCVDIRGVYSEGILGQLANKGAPTPSAEDVSIADLHAAIKKKQYPSDLLAEMRRLAFHILDTHERLLEAKPKDEAAFAAELHPKT